MKRSSQYLEEGVEDFEDLFLYEDRVAGVVREQLDEALFQHGHEDVHGGHQRLALFWLLVSVLIHISHINRMITLLLRVTRRYEARSETCDSLVVFDELVEAEQDAQPACAVV